MQSVTSKNLVGLDIGSHSIKAMELDWGEKGPRLKLFEKIELQPETIVDGALMDSESLSEAIGALVAKAKIRGREVAVTMARSICHARILGYNRAYVKESDEGFLDQMYEYFTADLGGGIGCPDIKDAMVDYQFLENPADPEYLKVLFVAASKEDAIYMLSEIKKAGLSPVIFDSNASALLNAYSFFNHKSQAKDVVACVHWGAEYVIINLFWGGMPQRIRVMSLGGNHIADAIRDQLKVSYEEAEAIKLKKKKGAAQNAEVEKIFSWASEELTKLVRGQVEFFFAINNHHSDLELKKIFISGGCSRIQGLPGIMEKKLGVPVEIFNPFSKITIDPGDFDPTAIKDIVSFAPVALGLALRGGTSNLSRINLLRPLRGE